MIYIDPPTRYVTAPYPNVKWSHIWCDEGEEEKLHEFAQKLGLKKEWFQNKPRFAHYDCVIKFYHKAIELGAQEKYLRTYIKENPKRFGIGLKEIGD